MLETLFNYLNSSGFGQVTFGNVIMIAIGLLFIFLAIRKGFEPLLLVPIGFGVLIGNIPYDAHQLSLGVHDGPVSESKLLYFTLDRPVTLPDGRRVEPYTLVHAEDAHLRTARVAEDGAPLDPDLPPWRLTWPTPKDRPDDRPPLLDPPVAPSVARDLVARGAAVMVHAEEYLTVPADDVVAPGILPLARGGHEVFVLRRAGTDAVPIFEAGHRYRAVVPLARQDVFNASVIWFLFRGVEWGFFPPLIFLGVGALTDFGPLLANPRTILLGAASQLGIFGALLAALFLGFNLNEAASIGIIGGADGPTAIFTCTKLAPHLLGAVALAAYSYMAMVPIIQPPIMRALTTRAERLIRMGSPKTVSRPMRIIFPIAGFLLTAFIANAALPLLGMLFFGNLLRESMVTERLAKTAQTTFIDIVTILLGVTVGAKTSASAFLTLQTIGIFAMGIVAFGVATAGGVLFAKLMNKFSRDPINPLIGAAGVSAVPMAARVVHRVAQEEDPQNFLLMHAMGPNVAGVIGSAVAAGVLLSYLG